MASADDKTKAFETSALPLFDALFGMAHWLTRNREEAEDLVQETYAKALRAFDSFEPGTNLKAWMFRILRNAFLNSRTALAYTQVEPLEDEQGMIADVAVPPEQEKLLLSQVTRDAVRAALERLHPWQREVLILREVDDMTYEEIAQTIGVPMGTVMSRLARARSAMRRELAGRSQEAKA